MKQHKKIAVNAILSLSVALLLAWGITLHNNNKKLSERLEMAQNNIEAY
jgi:ethanolamine utilization cobalamin adenosyltransferase